MQGDGNIYGSFVNVLENCLLAAERDVVCKHFKFLFSKLVSFFCLFVCFVLFCFLLSKSRLFKKSLISWETKYTGM